MIEIVLLIIIALLLAFIGWEKRESRLEISKLINALLAKNATEMANLDLADKTQIKAEVPKKDEFVPMEDLSDEEFKKAIL